ncbi:MAG: hypothetical protein KF709_12915, partial [Gemmatimonadaceae bacterium]|nr:hypothetical protein [Gemmatimonadaceae bacterium]
AWRTPMRAYLRVANPSTTLRTSLSTIWLNSWSYSLAPASAVITVPAEFAAMCRRTTVRDSSPPA